MQNTNKEQKSKIINTDKEPISFKCEQFFGRNWKYVAFFLCITIIVGYYELAKISNSMKELERIVYENNSKVVLTTADGRAIKVTKEPLKAEYLQKFAVSTLVNNFIVSRSQLTNEFSQSSFSNYEEMFQNVPNLKFILTNFIDSKGKDINKQAVGDFRHYVQWLLSALAQDKLPEYIAMKDHSVDKYEYNGNKFDTEITIKVVTQNYIMAQDKYISKGGFFKIQAQGSFDLSKSSDVNPYGMRIERIRIEPITKGS